MSRKQYSVRKQIVVATALALALSGFAYADDSSMSIWTGESYAYFNGSSNFPYGRPTFDKGPSSFRAANPHGLSSADYQALSSDGRPWPLPDPSEATTIASMDAATSWRRSHPHGLPISVYEAWSEDGRPWPLPNSATASALAAAGPASTSTPTDPAVTRIARFFGLFHRDYPSSAN